MCIVNDGDGYDIIGLTKVTTIKKTIINFTITSNIATFTTTTTATAAATIIVTYYYH